MTDLVDQHQLDKNDIELLQRAIELAKSNIENADGGPFGALIARGDEIIATGVNRVFPDCDPTAHAEIVAIRKACMEMETFDLSGMTLYTSCEPCPMCLGAIRWAQIDRVIFAQTSHDAASMGFADEEFYKMLHNPGENDKPELLHIANIETESLKELWCNKTERKMY